jgi:hypothetical protein
MSSRRAYRAVIKIEGESKALTRNYVEYSDVLNHFIALEARGKQFTAELSLFGVVMDITETRQLARDVLRNYAYGFNRSCAGTKDAEAWA